MEETLGSATGQESGLLQDKPSKYAMDYVDDVPALQIANVRL